MKARWTATLLLYGMAALTAPVLAIAQNLDVAVVVSESNHVSAVTLAELRKVFAGERRSWAVGMPIKLVVRAPGSHEHVAVLKLLGMSESEYKQYWISQVFRGEADSEPMSLPSVGVQMEALTIFAGAITFVSMQDVQRGMKVIKVNDHMPGEAGYPLH